MSDAVFLPLSCQELVKIENRDTQFLLHFTNMNESCEDLGDVSSYKVILSPLMWSGAPWEVPGSFDINLIKGQEYILSATGNFPANPNPNAARPYMDRLSNNATGSISMITDPNNPGQQRFIGTVVLREPILLNDNDVEHFLDLSFDYRIEPRVLPNIYSVRNIKLKISLQASDNSLPTNDDSQANGVTLLEFVNKKLFDNNVNVFIEFQTDRLGLNLGEMYCRLDSDRIYPNSYPQKHIGECVGYEIPTDSKIKHTFYSFKPNLNKVLRLDGEVLFEQTKNINDTYETGLTDCQFYFNILAYSTLRYIFAGLSNNSEFSIKWLCSNNYNKFIKNLSESEFSEAVLLFTEPQPEYNFDFSNYNNYYKKCKCQK